MAVSKENILTFFLLLYIMLLYRKRYNTLSGGRGTVVDFKEEQLCAICKKRVATKLCDAPKGRMHFIGHPPRYLMEKSHHSDVAFLTVQMHRVMTCDKPLCEKCAVSIFPEVDYCPMCAEKISEAFSEKRTKGRR